MSSFTHASQPRMVQTTGFETARGLPGEELFVGKTLRESSGSYNGSCCRHM